MATAQDVSIGIVNETVYKTSPGAPTRFFEPTDESLNWDKSIKQGSGLRVGARVARSARRVATSAQGGGDFTVETLSKGMGLLWEWALGAGTSTVVSGSTYQQVFTLGDTPPSRTVQKSAVRVDGTVDAYTYLGCMVGAWQFSFPNDDLTSLQLTIDAGDITTAQAYTAPSYPTAPTLFHFQGGSISTGAYTAPTSTTLASAATPLAGVRSGNISCNNNLSNRLNFGGGGRKDKPTVGLREISGSIDVEYNSTAFRDAVLNETPMTILLNFATPTALSTGFETLQIALPECKFDNQLVQANGTDLAIQSMNFAVLWDLTNQPITVVSRTSDTAL